MAGLLRRFWRMSGVVRNADRIWARTPQNLASEEVCAGLLFIEMSKYFRALLYFKPRLPERESTDGARERGKKEPEAMCLRGFKVSGILT